MIDVWGTAANLLWILGLSVLLAALSWAHWAASEEGVRFRVVLGRPRVRRTRSLGWALFCAGLAATARAWWEQVLWGLLVAMWLAQAVFAGRQAASQ